jgi:replicative DNA helicase
MSDLEIKLLSRLTDPAEIKQIWEMGVRPEVFETPSLRGVFTWIVDYWISNRMEIAPTSLILEHEFPAVQWNRVTSEPAAWLGETLQRRYSTNMAQQLMIAQANNIHQDPIGALKTMWQGFYRASEVVAPRHQRSDMSNVEERRELYSQQVENRNRRGLTLGIPEVDEFVGDLLPGELCALGARPGVGKSFYLVNAVVASLRQGVRPILFTLEQNIREMETRIDAFYSGVSYDRLSKAHLDFNEVPILRAAQEHMRENIRPIIRRPPRGDRSVTMMVNMARQEDAHYLLIDQLSFMDSEERYEDYTGKHSEIMFDLKEEISRETLGAIPCLVAVQLNRKTEEQGGRGELHNFANSDVIGQTVDLALGLSRTREERANMSMRLDIMKSRRSDVRSWLLAWHLQARSEISAREEAQD